MSTHPTARHAIAEWAATLVFLMFGTTTLVQAFVIPTPSMDSTLQVGDYLLVDKLAYAPAPGPAGALLPYAEPKRGEVIVFRYPPDISVTYVKRLMGLPGDRIRMEGGRLWVNGTEMEEPYARPGESRDAFPPGGGELVVPDGRYFALGDNRGNSADSRAWGFVPRANIIGRPLLVYWSWDARKSSFGQPRWNRIFTRIR
jgi:signal peptidase I